MKKLFPDKEKEIYHKLCQQADVPIFLKDWWLDAVCGSSKWYPIIAYKGDQVAGALPLYIKKTFPKKITLPPLTQINGPIIPYSAHINNQKKLSLEHDVLNRLIINIPNVPRIRFHLPYSLTNWLPFFWHGFSQTTRYTYIINDLSELSTVWKNFKENIRREIRKAKKELYVEKSTNVSDLYLMNKHTFSRQGKSVPFSEIFLTSLYSACSQKNAGDIFIAKNHKGEICAAIFIVYDKHSAYYIAGGADTQKRTNGAMSLLLWEAIQETAQKNIPCFNFEGSMIESIERFFSAFGAQQQPYIAVYKNSITDFISKMKHIYHKIR